MNVLLVTRWDQASGGVASVVRNLAKHLEGSGHRVMFLHPGPSNRGRKRVTAAGFNGYEINLRAVFIKEHPVKSVLGFITYFLPTVYRLGLLVREHRIEIINIHYPTELFLYFGVLRWLVRIRLVVSVHGEDVFPGGSRMRRYPLALRFVLWCADAVVAPSYAFLADVLAVLPWVAKSGVAIHNGIEIDEFRPMCEEVDRSRSYVLCIAAHNEKKALDVLLEAFAEIVGAHPDISLRLVGDGPLRPRLEDRARALGLRDNVDFLGERSREEVARLLRACLFFVLPSRAESFGLVLCEAMASRKAVVASAIGGIREVVEDGKSGLLVGPEDPRALARAMGTLLEDDAQRESMADTGYKRVLEHFGLARMGDRYLNLFSSLIQGGLAAQGQRLRIPGNTER